MTDAKVQHFMGSQPSKWTQFRTAIALVSVGAVKAGDYVAITHHDIVEGSHWLVTATQRGPIEPVVMADHQLHRFVL